MRRLIASLIAWLALSLPALAAYQPGAVVNVPTYATVAAGNYANTPYLRVAEAVTGLGGGGDFYLGTCTPDSGVCIADSAGNHFLRIFKGHVQMAWYGVADATSTTCAANFSLCASDTAFAAAQAAALTYGDGWVSTGGRSIVLYTTVPIIPSYGGVDCELPAGTILNQSTTANRLYNKPNSLVINPDNIPTGIYRSIYSRLQNCIIRPTWMANARPAGFTSGSTYVPTTVHDNVVFRRLYRGVGTTASTSATSVTNVQVYGFETGFDQSSSGDTAFGELVTDDNVHGYFWGQRSGFAVHNWSAQNVNARLSANGVTISTLRWPISTIADDGTGQIKITVDNTFNAASNCGTFSTCMAAGYTVLVANFDQATTRAQTHGDVYNSTDGVTAGVCPATAPYCIANVPNTQGNGEDGISSIQIGSTIQDNGGAGCVFTGLTVTSKDEVGGFVYLSGPVSGCSSSPSGNEPLVFISSSSGAAGANSRWQVGTVSDSPTTLILQGSSYSGPTFTGVKWDSGLPTLRVYDVTNVFDGQYICVSGTAPFCTAPTAFQVATTTSSDVASLSTTGTGNIHVTSTANWPAVGILKFPTDANCSTNEYMRYHLVTLTNKTGYNATLVNIDTRGWDAQTGTCTGAHVNNTAGIVVSAPRVVQAIPTDGDSGETAAVVIDANAQSAEASGQTIHFANDNTQTTSLAGQLILNLTYSTYSANHYTAGGIWVPFIANGDTNSVTTPTLLKNVVNPTKVQPGMSVTQADGDIPTKLPSNISTTGTWSFPAMSIAVAAGANIYPGMGISASGIPGDTFVTGCYDSSGNACGGATGAATVTLSHATTAAKTTQAVTASGVVVVSVSGSTVTLNTAATGTHSAHQLSFSGCGWPATTIASVYTPEPWLGNCPSSAVVLGSLTDQANQGNVLAGVHIGQTSNYVISHNSPATQLFDGVFDNGSGKGAQIDPYSVGFTFDGKGNNTVLIAHNKIGGDNTSVFLDLNAQSDNIRIIGNAMGDGGGIAFAAMGPASTVTVTSNSSSSTGVVYVSHNISSLSINSFMAPNSYFAYDTSALNDPNKLSCSSNTFLNTFCADDLAIAIGVPTAGGVITGGINTQTGAYKNGVEYSNYVNSTFTPTGASTAGTLLNFGDRALSLLDFGGIPDGNTANSAANTTALTNAMTAALAANVHVIRMDCLNAVGCAYAMGNITISSGIEIYCPMPLQNPSPTNSDYRTFPGAIVMTQNGGLTFSAGSGMRNCSYFKSGLYASTPPTDYQTKYARKTAYSGIGITCGDICTLDRNIIMGFATAVKIAGARTAYFRDNLIDSTNCFQFHGQKGGGVISGDGNVCSTYGTVYAIPTVHITGFSDSSGTLHITYPTCSTGDCPFNGYKLWVINPGSNQSAQGGWVAANVTSTGADLTGATSAFLTGYAQTASTTTGSFRVTGFSTNINQYHKTQSISDGAVCIPAGATIAAVWRTLGIIYLDSAHPATCNETASITVTDTSPGTSSIDVATIDSGGTGYTVGDILFLSGGTFTSPAQIQVDEIDNGSGSGAGVVTASEILDGGIYTVLPSPNPIATTGGTGSGATFDIDSVAEAALYSSIREGTALDIASVNSLRFSHFKELGYATGLSIGNSANDVTVDSCDLHDENFLQDQSHTGILFTGTAKGNVVECGSYYFGAAVKDNTFYANSDATPNTVRNSLLGGPTGGNAGFQTELFEVESGTPGSNKRLGTIFTNNFFKGPGVAFVSDDANRGVVLSGNVLPQSILYGQSSTTPSLLSGTGNTFATGSLPIYTASSVTQLAPSVQNAGNGSTLLTNTTNTITEGSSGSFLIDSGALTNNRNVVLSNTGATGGYTVTLSRHGSSGGFNRVVKQSDGTTTLDTVADGATGVYYFDPNSNLWVKL